MGLRLPLNPRAREGPDKGRTVGGRGGKEKRERTMATNGGKRMRNWRDLSS